VLPSQQPLQIVPLQVQRPPWQPWPVAQRIPQPPQLAGSLCASTQYRFFFLPFLIVHVRRPDWHFLRFFSA
jgi:hypothetical protein